MTDVVDADSIETVNNIILGRGFIPTKVSPVGGGSAAIGFSRFKNWLNPVKAAELILFTKQFKTMLREIGRAHV